MRSVPRRLSPALFALSVAALVACGPVNSTANTAGTAAVSSTIPAPTTVPVAEPTPVATAPPADEPTSWKMPNLVGSNLQEAQDAIQALTGNKIFFTKSHDATGRGRRQILDRDWTVCTQNVRPGTTITPDTAIDFGAAKLSEQCGGPQPESP